MNIRQTLIPALLALATVPAHAQTASAHWTGAIQAPGREFPTTVNLSTNAKGEWIGSISFSSAVDSPLSAITVAGTAVKFTFDDIPNKAPFEGKLSADGTRLLGSVELLGYIIPFALQRDGEPKVNLPAPSSALSSDFARNWEGSVATPEGEHPISLKLTGTPGAAGKGTLLTRVDGVNREYPFDTLTQTGKQLHFEIRILGAAFEGTLNESSSELKGTWKEAGDTLAASLHLEKP